MWPALVSRPKLSAIITCHNYKEYVGEAISSVHGQTYENLECIIIDDASTDGSVVEIRKILKTLADPRFRLVEAMENLGQMGAMLVALGEATGDFIGFLDADDIWCEDFVERHIAAHLNHIRSAGMSCCDMGVIGKDRQLLTGTYMALDKSKAIKGGQLSVIKPAIRSKDMPEQDNFSLTPDQIFYLEQTKPAMWTFSPTSACVFRRDLLTLIAPRDTTGFRKSADYYFIMLASILTGCLIIEKVCCYYRIHGANVFSSHPVVGGTWISGQWAEDENKKSMMKIIQAMNQNYGQLSSVFGRWQVLEAVRKLNHDFSVLEMKRIAPLIFDDLFPWKLKNWKIFKA